MNNFEKRVKSSKEEIPAHCSASSRSPRHMSALLLPALCLAQSPIYQLTAQNFATAAAQPVTWLLAIEPGQGAGLTAPSLLQAARYYNQAQTGKGVRVGKVDLVQSPELRRVLCGGGACPAMLALRPGELPRPYRGRSALGEVQAFVEAVAAGSAAASRGGGGYAGGGGGGGGYAAAGGEYGGGGYGAVSASGSQPSAGGGGASTDAALPRADWRTLPRPFSPRPVRRRVEHQRGAAAVAGGAAEGAAR